MSVGTLPKQKQPAREAVRPKGMAVRFANGIVIPDWVRDHESFRRWVRSNQFPEKSRVAFFDGDLWVDPSMEPLYVHNHIKTKVASALLALAESSDIGTYGADGMVLSSPEVGLTTIPDGCFVSFDRLDQGQVREIKGNQQDCIEFEGSPDMVLEVVSDSSEEKDLDRLRDLYFKAGIAEYWIIDARSDTIVFDILKRGPKAYVATRKQSGGWVKSEVFGKTFRITRTVTRRGKPIHNLEMK
jgi:Uma2 family endonuclease